jgi:hypothetical protein
MVGALTACDRPDPSAGAAAPVAAAALKQIAPFRFAEPRVGTLRLVSRTAVTNQPTATDLVLTGRLAILPDQGGVRVALLEARVSLNGQDEPTLTNKLAIMSRGAVWHFNLGSVESIGLPEGSSPEASNFWRTLASAFQYVPSLQGASTQVEQYDSTGRHTVQYGWAAGVLTRKKLAYIKVLQSGPTMASLEQLNPHIIASEAGLVMKDEALERFSSKEQVRTDLQKGVTLDITTELSLSALSSLSQDDPAFSQLKGATFGTGFLPLKASEPIQLSQKVDQAQFDEVRIKDWPFETALEALIRDSASRQHRAQRSDDEKRRTYSAHAAVTAYLRSVPAKLETAQKLLWSKPQDAAALLGPLGEAGTSATQELLLRFAEDAKVPLGLRSIAVIQIGQTKEPIAALAPGVVRLVQVEGLRQQALLNLGTLGRHLREAGRTEEFNQVSAAIEAEFANVSPARSVADVLCAVSNLGDERLLERVRPFLTSPDAKIRGDAVLALRHMKSPAVDPLIAAALSNEHSKLALLTVLSSMNIRPPLPMHKEALRALLARPDLERQVRGRAQQLLDSWQNL